MSTVSQHTDGNGNIIAGSGDVQSNSPATTGNQSPAIVAGGDVSVSYNSPPPPPPPIPRHLPSLEPCFLHREEELAWLNDRLHPGKVAAVCGLGGMGKSALAAQAVHQLEDTRFPDGIVFYSFYGKHSVEEAVAYIVRSYDEAQQDTSFAAASRLLANKQALLILDGAEEADDLPALLRLRGACGVLITSRKRTDALADRLDLKPLEEQPAAEVFRLYSGVAADDAGVQGICKLLGGWPVALRIAGRYLSTTGESAADSLKWLEQEPFKELASGQHQEENAALLLRRSVDAVSWQAQFALTIIGALAFDIFTERPVVALLKYANYNTPWEFCRWLRTMIAHRRTWLLRCTDDDLRFCQVVLNELVAYGLLEKQDDRWKVSHALIHVYLRSKMPLNRWLLKGLARSYIVFCQEQSAAGLQGYARLDAERAHCLRLIESCLASKLWQEVKGLANATYTYLDRQGHWTDQLTAIGMRLTAAQQAGDRKDEGDCLNELGCTCWRRGEYEQALRWHEQSLLIDRELGDRQGEASNLDGIATIYQIQGKHELALQTYQQSLSIRREVGDRQGEGTTLNNIGTVYYDQGDNETALQQYEQCLPIHREVGTKSMEGITLNNIAPIYDAQGKPAKALEYLEQALAIAQQLGNRDGEARTRWNIGLTYKDLGDLAKAEEYISQAVQIKEAIGSPNLEDSRKTLARVQAARRA
uniref:tetratricopeptide repeat protein n=1 Tax=Candidatus Electronema sp. TaxID=2698783 RepID=UPI0040571625